MKKKVCLVGGYSFENYGDEITYYSLYAVLKECGYDVILSSWPYRYKRYFKQYCVPGRMWIPRRTPFLFRECPYEQDELFSSCRTRSELSRLNQMCDVFIVGSGQYFHSRVMNNTRYYTLLDWVNSKKIKIAYSAAWGNVKYSTLNKQELDFIGHYLRRFSAFSVRERGAEIIAKDIFGISAEWVMDPVFLCSKDLFCKLSKKAEHVHGESDYVFSYMLDASITNGNAIKGFGENNKLDVINVCASSMHHATECRFEGFERMESDVKIEDWLNYIKNCKVMVTDSFHGLCMALIFCKPFILITRPFAGNDRYLSLLGYLGLLDHIVEKPEEIINSNVDYWNVDYITVKERINIQSDASKKWLLSQIESVSIRNDTEYENRMLSEASILDRIVQRLNFMKEDLLSIKHIVGRILRD